jgi:hypothetical protein
VWVWAVDLNPTVGSPYLFSLTLADHFDSFLPLVWPLALAAAPPLSLSSQVIAATQPNPSRRPRHLLLSKVSFLSRLDLRRVGASLQLDFGGGKKKGGNGENSR